MDQDLEQEITLKPEITAPRTITDMKKFQDGTKLDLVIAALKKSIEESDTPKEDSQINLAISYLGLEMTNKALEILNNVIKANNLCSLAYLLRGITYLWIGKDENALASWKDGISQGGQYSHYALMSNLISDLNFRTHVYTLRFSIENLFQIIESWDNFQTFTDNDLREAFKELNSNIALAITHFSQVLSVDQKNASAYLGRGIGYCLTGQWIRAIDDINHAILENCESMHMAHRFRSVAYAAIGKFTYAIGDITRVIGKFPKDREARLLRARFEIKLGLFKQACTDIMSIPSDTLTNKDWCTLAECLYATGALKEALEALCRTDQHSPNALYVSFLVLRDVGQYDLALKKICAAVEQNPSPFIQRKLADFLLEVGRPDHAIPLYEQFYQLCRGDISAIHAWAMALFMTNNLKDAARVIVPFADNAGPGGIPMLQEHERPELKLNGELTYNGTSLLGKNIMDKIWADRCLILDTIKNLNNPINSMLQNNMAPPDESEVDYEHFEFPNFEPTQVEIQMVADADRIGARCVHRGMEVIQYNSRVVRALGFAVLMAAALMRESAVPPKIDTDKEGSIDSLIDRANKWRGKGALMIDFFTCLMNLASPMTEVRSNYDMLRPDRAPELLRILPGSRDPSEMWAAPTYYLVRGHRTSPRFDPAIPSAVQKVVRTLSETPNRVVMPYNDIRSAKTIEQVYEMTQKNISITSKWMIPECAGIPENRREMAAPTIILQSLGVLGYNFCIRAAPASLPAYSVALDAINNLFRAISESENAITALTALISLVWIRHPLTNFSPELGYVLLHAFGLAKLNVELAESHFGFAEDFILHMIDTDTGRLEKMIKQHIQNNQIMKSFAEESINYWTEPYPNVYRILSLLDVTNDAH